MKLAFNIKRCGLMLGLLGSIAAAMAQNTAKLRNGDLLFCCANMKTASSFSRSIVASTKGRGSNDINHVAIVCIERGATFIIEATGDKGVWMCPIDTFISRAPKADAPKIENVAASTTLGDIDVLAQLKAQMEKGE